MARGRLERHRRQSGLSAAWACPALLNAACTEIWNATNISFALCPLLSHGGIEALEAHASDVLKETYLGRIVSGEWTATMNLTEPQAGSDLALLRTRAARNADGSYRIDGQKIFITYGEHDLVDNILHLVLARLPDAPAGREGHFAVPRAEIPARRLRRLHAPQWRALRGHRT